MQPESELRRSGIAGAVLSTIVIALTCYLSFAALQGEHGLFRLFQVEALEPRLQSELARLKSERAALANKTRRLSSEHLDLELLDEQARKILGLGRPDELMVR